MGKFRANTKDAKDTKERKVFEQDERRDSEAVEIFLSALAPVPAGVCAVRPNRTYTPAMLERRAVVQVNEVAALRFLREQLDPASEGVEAVGAGAWSRAFGFRRGEDQLVVRFGQHVDDFEKDRRAFAYRAPGLPVPEVVAIGRAFDGYFAVSRRVHGEVLEALPLERWRAVVPSVVDALEALRLADVAGTWGYGAWDGNGRAPFASWRDYMLAVAEDPPGERTQGWRAKLGSHAEGSSAFKWGFERLRELASDDVPRCLIHADLMNRNVLVEGARISGVFDWGCAAYGDHLYDLAWFEFWAPWHPNLDVALLRKTLEARWLAAAYSPSDLERRLVACYLHIGLGHLGYNAHLGDWETLEATAERMRHLATFA